MIDIHDLHSRLMFKNPIKENCILYYSWLKLYGYEKAKTMLVDWIKEQNEYKYLGECLDTFLSWKCKTKAPDDTEKTQLRVRYYGPIGTSGYAKVCRDIIHSLNLPSSCLDVEFVPISVQNMNKLDSSVSSCRLASACRVDSADHVRHYDIESRVVDVVVMHSVPDLWIQIVRRERSANQSVVTYGVTVWETDGVPPQWIPHLQWVDRVSFPNKWNAKVFNHAIPELD